MRHLARSQRVCGWPRCPHRLAGFVFGQVGQEIHEALEDLQPGCFRLVMEGHRLAGSYKALKQRVTCLKTLTRRVTKGKVAPGVLRGLKIDLREVLARNIMVDTPLREIL